MFRFEEYSNDKEKDWDDFIFNRSINGTFLQSRRFLNYHSKDKFVDCSVIVYNKKNNIAAVIPACEIIDGNDKVFYSHKGSTFGGIVTDKKHHNAKYIMALAEELKGYLNSHGYNKAYFKMTADTYSCSENDLFSYAFWRAGYKEYKELSTYVDYSKYKEDILSNFSQGKRTNVHNCIKEGLACKELDTKEEIEQFYGILCENLAKHDTKPVHTIEELLDFKENRLKEEIGFFGIYLGAEMIACSMMFYFKQSGCAHTQYLAAKQEYNKLSPMTFMYYSMILEMKERGFKRISWGTATEDLGEFLNMGLISSKEDFGSSYINNCTYYIELK